MRAAIVATALLAVVQSACSDRGPIPPVAERRTTEIRRHGRVFRDPYAWLRDREDPAVIAHLTAENAYADAVLAPAAPLIDAIEKELTDRVPQADLSVPVRKGPWEYWSRTEAGRAYPVYCRRRPPDGVEEVYLDVNRLAEGNGYLGLGAARVSHDHRRLAYSTDTTGRERYTLRFRDLSTGEDFPEPTPPTASRGRRTA